MIESYIEKGIYLHNAIEAAGHSLTEVDGIWFSSDDVIVQDIIDTFDPLPDAQSSARLRVKQHAAGLVSDIYPHIDPNATDVVSFYNYTVDMWQGGARGARGEARAIQAGGREGHGREVSHGGRKRRGGAQE